MYFKFVSKANTLAFLKQKKIKANINDFVVLTKKKILLNDKWADLILKKFIKKSIILRSSSLEEDQNYSSNAGKFDTYVILHPNKKNLIECTQKIISNFGSNQDAVMFQEFLKNPDLSGVIFTRDLNNLAPYYIINYDKSGRTDLVTSGKKNISQKTLIIYRNYKKITKKFLNLIKLTRKLEEIFQIDYLDIEFAIKNKKIYIFQVRPITKKNKNYDNVVDDILVNLKKKLNKLQKQNSLIDGRTTIFSNMSDWNPAEMIGSKSDTLSISMYEELITDSIWAQQRFNYGYKDVEGNPLMIDFVFSPYIDLRTDLNSFLPENLPKKIQKKTINYLIKKLKNHPELHDKIEFSLMKTCNSFDLKDYLSKFLNNTESNIYKKNLINLTNQIINSKSDNLFNNDIKKINILKKKLFDNGTSKNHPIQNIFYLINLIKKKGTLPFSGIARTAFIYTSILRDLEINKKISSKKLLKFYNNIDSINNIFILDLKKYINKKLSKKVFLAKYGHLRPNMYSIESFNYKEGINKYFDIRSTSNQKLLKNDFEISNNAHNEITKFLTKNSFLIDSKKLFDNARRAIYHREYSKYVFSKGIDLIFKNLIELGKSLNISRDDLKFISIKTIKNAYNNLHPIKFEKILKNEILQNKKLYYYSKMIKLPDVITTSSDIFQFTQDLNKENYVTNFRVESGIYLFQNSIKKFNPKKIINKIVFIENADPGYDFIFSYKIKGLITQYGGANSHMSIRCMEQNIPAAIGIGEKKFNFFSKCKKIQLDCERKKITKLY